MKKRGLVAPSRASNTARVRVSIPLEPHGLPLKKKKYTE